MPKMKARPRPATSVATSGETSNIRPLLSGQGSIGSCGRWQEVEAKFGRKLCGRFGILRAQALTSGRSGTVRQLMARRLSKGLELGAPIAGNGLLDRRFLLQSGV